MNYEVKQCLRFKKHPPHDLWESNTRAGGFNRQCGGLKEDRTSPAVVGVEPEKG